MANVRHSSWRPAWVSDSSLFCFAIAAGAFGAAALVAVVNHYLVGWMAVGGMAAVGLLYLAMGLITLGTSLETAEDAPKKVGDDAEIKRSLADRTQRKQDKVGGDRASTTSENDSLVSNERS